MYIKRELYTSKEIYVYQKRTNISNIYIYIYIYIYTSQESCTYQKRPVYIKRDLCISKET